MKSKKIIFILLIMIFCITSIGLAVFQDEIVDSSDQLVTSIGTPLWSIIGWLITTFIIIWVLVVMVNFIKARKELKNLEGIERKEKSRQSINKLIIGLFSVGVVGAIAWVIDVATCVAAKPIIYLYPEKEQEVSVKIGHPEKLTCTYPKYKNSWNVIAKPNGDLIDIETNRNLYALYWEGKNTIPTNMKEGFVVKGEDSIKFLEEKLAILGLNEREANEFIIYWLPKLEKNKYNFIRFQRIEEINENMPLEISPKPDTIIRIMMEFKGLNKPIEVKEQELVTPERNGFVVVEWGGTEV